MGYSIYYMERPVTETWFGEEVVRSHHAFLALVREDQDNSPIIEQEIHFKNEGFLKLKIHQYPHKDFGGGGHFGELLPYGHVGGSEDHVKSLWGEIQKTAEAIEKGKLSFASQRFRDSFNCRSATIALLRSIGLEYYAPKDAFSDAGVEADILAKIGVPRARPEVLHSPFELQKTG